MADLELQIRDVEESSRFEVSVDGVTAGFAEYRRDGGVITFTHTVIDDAFDGQGLGGRLAAAALDSARAGGLRVVPRCSFIARYIERHPDYADLVDPT